MFYFDQIENKKILKSDFIENAFFTTREICICDKSFVTNPHPHLYHSQVREQRFPLPSGERPASRGRMCADWHAKWQDKQAHEVPFIASRSRQGWDEEAILKNKKIISSYLKIEPQKLISPIQTHSANIETATEGRIDYPDTDGLILTDNNLAVFLNFADCTPIILYDEEQNIGAVAHAGWRGTAAKISQKTVKKMISEYNSKPQDIAAVIGPAICAKCYEVGADVYSVFDHSFDSKNCGQGQKFHIDIKEINAKQLAEVGIENIDVCPYCTCCDNEYFFSYRKENGTTLRHSAVLYLR